MMHQTVPLQSSVHHLLDYQEVIIISLSLSLFFFTFFFGQIGLLMSQINFECWIAYSVLFSTDISTHKYNMQE